MKGVDVKEIRRLVTSTEWLTALMLFGLLLAWISAMRLRFAFPVRDLFQETCVVTPDEEVIPTFAIFLVGVYSATACFYVLCRRHPALRRVMFGSLIAVISFTIGVYLTGAI